MFDRQAQKKNKEESEALGRANSILMSLNAFMDVNLQKKYPGKTFAQLNVDEKTRVINLTVCEYIADHMKNDNICPHTNTLVSKITGGISDGQYQVVYPDCVSEEDKEYYGEKELEATALLLASLQDQQVEVISKKLPTREFLTVFPNDTVKSVVLQLMSETVEVETIGENRAY